MVNTILFTIAFLWLFALTAQQSRVSNWFKTLQEERSRVLAFIDEAKASWSKDHHQEKEQ